MLKLIPKSYVNNNSQWRILILFLSSPPPERFSHIHSHHMHMIDRLYITVTPGRYFSQEDSGLLRILEENEWRGIGITQSLGWEHFEVHGE